MSEAEQFLVRCLQHVRDQKLRAICKVANTLERDAVGLASYAAHQISNGTAESLNAKIQLLKSTARRFRFFENYKINILFYLGKLDMQPLKIQ